MQHRHRVITAIVAAGLAVPLAAATSASAAPAAAAKHGHPEFTRPDKLPTLPAPPRPPTTRPQQRAGYQAPTALTRKQANGAATAQLTAFAAPSQAATWGSGSASTLVVYDTTDTWGWLGELYAIAGVTWPAISAR
jgi:hypothetical protein